MEIKKNEIHLIFTLKNMVSKLEKSLGIEFNANLATLKVCIQHGIAVVNAMAAEAYTTENFPSELEGPVLVASCLHLLKDAQQPEYIIEKFNELLVVNVKGPESGVSLH